MDCLQGLHGLSDKFVDGHHCEANEMLDKLYDEQQGNNDNKD
jgi:hypothetical protein